MLVIARSPAVARSRSTSVGAAVEHRDVAVPASGEQLCAGHGSLAMAAHHRHRLRPSARRRRSAPSSTLRAPGTWPAAYSLAWRTSMIVPAMSDRRRRSGIALHRPSGRPPRRRCLRRALRRGVRGRRRGTGGRGRRGPDRRSRTNTSGRSASTSQPSQLANTGRSVFDSDPGMCPAANAATGRASTTIRARSDGVARHRQVSAPAVWALCRSGRVRAGSVRAAERSRWGTCRIRRRAARRTRPRHRCENSGFVARSRPMVGGALRRARRRAERPGTVRRIDGKGVGQSVEAAQTAEHLVRQRHRQFWPAQIGPAHGADHQRTTGEQRYRLAVLGQQVGVVIRGVAWRRERAQRDSGANSTISPSTTGRCGVSRCDAAGATKTAPRRRQRVRGCP